MKKILFIFIVFLFFSCEDEIELDLDTAPPRLVIDAFIDWRKGTAGNEQNIKLSETVAYSASEVKAVNNATVYIQNSSGGQFDFIESGNSGIYSCLNFIPEINETYTLTVIHDNENYTATETLKSVVPIDSVSQEEGGLTGEETQINAYYTDPADETNYYFFRFNSSVIGRPELDVFEDEFFNGNQIFAAYFEEDIDPGDIVEITIAGISQSYFNYMQILIDQTGAESGGPFSTIPATVRGNIINTTNFDNFALGYFNLSETDFVVHTVE